MNSTDEQLVYEYLKKNNDEALEILIKRYLPLIYGFVKRYTGNQDMASDITQETFVKVWKNLKSFDPRKASPRGGQSKTFKTWVFTIAKRTAIDWLKKKNALPFSALENEEGDSFVDSLADKMPLIFDQLNIQETNLTLANAVASLSNHYSTVINLHINKGLSFREISGSLKEPLNTVKSRYRRGIAILKKLYKQ